jgi:polysaccharide chain length determinant protein (PEP-CTERM system associated)
MDELIRQLLSAARGVWQHRWSGLAVAWLVGLAALGWLYTKKDEYEATARVYVDTQSVLKPLMSGLAVQPNIEEQVRGLTRTLISRPNVEKLVRMADLDLTLTSPEQRERLIEGLTASMQLKAAGGTNLYTISYRHPDRAKARKVVESLLSIFVESGLGDKRRDSEAARSFIEDQIAIYERRLQEAENRLKEFKLQHMQVGAGGENYFVRMEALEEGLSYSQLELRAAEESRDALKRQLAGEEPVFLPDAAGGAGGASGVLPEIDARIDAQKRALDEMLRRFTDEHPDVIGTRRVIAALEEQRKQELAARKPAGPQQMGSADTNPVYQQLKVALAEAEANVAALRVRVAQGQSKVNTLRAAARQVPEVEAQFAQLNRDYEVQKKNYEGLVSRRESAAMTGEMEARGSAVEFRVVDPPRTSTQPVGATRTLLLPVALLFALAAGAAAAFGVSQVLPTFHDTSELRGATKRAVLGAVSLVLDDGMLRRRRRMTAAFFGAFGALVAAYGAAASMLLLAARVS